MKCKLLTLIKHIIMKLIPLSKGYFTYVDDNQYDYLMQWKWCAHNNGKNQVYATTNIVDENGNKKTVRMHRILLGLNSRKEHADHINGNTLLNTMSNLRKSTVAQNGWNKGKQKNNTSGYKGVFWLKQNNAWKACIRANKKIINIGLFKTKEEAAVCYNIYARKYHGNFCKLNDVDENIQLSPIKRKPGKHGYFGVIRRESLMYSALIRHNKKQINLGTYLKAEDAAKAYDEAAKVLHGEFAILNFTEPQTKTA